MATYRFLADAYVGTIYYLAGSTASTADVGGSLPTNWKPSGAVDPLDSPAVTAFYAAGPQASLLARTQWSTIPVGPPATYWKSINAYQCQLTGLGASLAPVGGGSLILP